MSQSLKKSLQTCIKFFFLADFFVFCLYLPLIFSLRVWKRKKRESEPPAGLEEAALKSSFVKKSPQWKSPPRCRSGKSQRSSCGQRKGAGLVGESLTGLFPATGCAPHVSLLHAVHLSALLCLPTGFPVSWCRFRWRRYQSMVLVNSGVCAGCRLPLFSEANCPDMSHGPLQK